MLPWKFLGAIIAPPKLMGGWLCFGMALAFIGLVTAVIGDLAGLFGCCLGLEDQVTVSLSTLKQGCPFFQNIAKIWIWDVFCYQIPASMRAAGGSQPKHISNPALYLQAAFNN